MTTDLHFAAAIQERIAASAAPLLAKRRPLRAWFESKHIGHPEERPAARRLRPAA